MPTFLTKNEVQGIRVGDRVLGTVERIIVVEWNAEEARRLNVPQTEWVYVLSDGTRAGTYDRVSKIDDKPTGSDRILTELRRIRSELDTLRKRLNPAGSETLQHVSSCLSIAGNVNIRDAIETLERDGEMIV